jgi:hypothetical protein
MNLADNSGRMTSKPEVKGPIVTFLFADYTSGIASNGVVIVRSISEQDGCSGSRFSAVD